MRRESARTYACGFVQLSPVLTAANEHQAHLRKELIYPLGVESFLLKVVGIKSTYAGHAHGCKHPSLWGLVKQDILAPFILHRTLTFSTEERKDVPTDELLRK
ncbi:hypothetical protein GCM10027590_54780 [Nocardiopsis nanhaiensis]